MCCWSLGEGRLTELVVKGDIATARVVRDGFSGGPTAVTLADGMAYVVEAKFAYRSTPELRGKDPGPFEVIAVPYTRR